MSLFVRKLDVTDDNNGQDNHADEDLDDEGWVGGDTIRAPNAIRLDEDPDDLDDNNEDGGWV